MNLCIEYLIATGGGRIGPVFKISSSLKKLSFTLSEVLITLVVIGIIAAITVPVIVSKHQKEQTEIQLKKHIQLFLKHS